MREHRVTLPQIALIAGTRGLIGIGVGLLISERMAAERRKAVGIALVAAGALSTIPLAWRLFRAPRAQPYPVVERAERVSPPETRVSPPSTMTYWR
jgi:hypothetical protein